MEISTNPISIAPMVDKTDRHFRNFFRMINKDVLLYTEMITAQAILNGDVDYLLEIDNIEKPISLQIATSNPKEAYEALKIAEKYDYDEINLNVGCPSDKVSGNMMGAVLMAYPELVSEILLNMRKATKKPITIKHRIGIDGTGILDKENHNKIILDKYEDMENFVEYLNKNNDISKYIIHARIAILNGLDPKENREIPPIRYEEVYKLKNSHKNLNIEINGGIKSITDIENHLNYVDSVMIGREAYDNPMMFTKIGEFYNKQDNDITRLEIIENLIKYIEKTMNKGHKPNSVLRHTHGLFHGVDGSKKWKQLTNADNINKYGAINILNDIINKLKY